MKIGDSQRLVQAVFSLAVKLQPCINFLGAPNCCLYLAWCDC